MRCKLSILGGIAIATLSIGIATAAASRLSFSNRNFRVVWAPLTITGEEISTPVRCKVTIEGSFHSATVVKTLGALIGYVTKGTAAACEGGGTMTVNQEALPWHVRYRGFTGTLPNVTGVQLGFVNARFTIADSWITCSFTSTATQPVIATAAVSATVITGLRAAEGARIGAGGPFPCEMVADAGLVGTGTVRLLNSITAITVRLI